MELTKKLNKIQQELKCKKGQRNTFGNYAYRSCEDILEAVKPLLGDSVLTISDEIIQIGERYYVKAIAMLRDDNQEITVSGFAREAGAKKGFDESQITGATSSYARKYALNGLFAIDDTKDADTQDNTDKTLATMTASAYGNHKTAPQPTPVAQPTTPAVAETVDPFPTVANSSYVPPVCNHCGASGEWNGAIGFWGCPNWKEEKAKGLRGSMNFDASTEVYGKAPSQAQVAAKEEPPVSDNDDFGQEGIDTNSIEF